ncbi:unnamed protein product [Penicillium salamii]|nr:unnamed protein product [Penicillium salamii]
MAKQEIEQDYLDLGNSFLEDLPSSIKRYVYEGESSFLRIFSEELYHREPSERSDFLLFHVSGEMIEVLFDPNKETTILTRNSSSFDLNEELLLIKMPSDEHAFAIGAVDHAVMATLLPMGLYEQLLTYPGATIQGNTGGKQPDYGWGPRITPPNDPRRPSVVLEVAWSESDAKLNSDVRFWLNPTDGNARTCLTLRVDRHTPTIRIEKWKLRNDTGRLHRYQIVRVTRVSGETRVSAHPLIIPFEDFFLRPPSTPAEKDMELSEQALRTIAETIWDGQGF